MAVGFRGGSSGGSSGGIDFDSDYFDVPVIPLNKIIPKTDYSAPVTGGDGGVSSTNFMANVPVNYDPVTKPVSPLLYEGVDPNFQNVIASEPNYFTTESLTDQDIENYLSDTENFVYNPGTGDFEPAGKYTYPLSQLAPGYSDTQEKFMLGVKPGMTGQQLQDIEANRLNTQKLAFEVPMGEGLNMFDNYHQAFTGFDSSGNLATVDPGTQAMNNVPDYSQPTQSVFDEGGVFGGKQ